MKYPLAILLLVLFHHLIIGQNHSILQKADSLFRQSNYEETLDNFYIKLDGMDANQCYQAAIAYTKLEKADQAVGWLQKAVEKVYHGRHFFRHDTSMFSAM